MKKMQRLKDLLALKQELQENLMQYLEEEFFSLYEYLSNGEDIEDFILPFYQAMIILEEEKELLKLIQNQMEVEYMEEAYLKDTVILRIGMRQYEDIQLCYFIYKDWGHNKISNIEIIYIPISYFVLK